MRGLINKLRKRLVPDSKNRSQSADAHENTSIFEKTARADEIAPRVDLTTFLHDTNCHILACPAGRVALNAPRVMNGVNPNYKIQEPDGLPKKLPSFPSESFYPDLTISRLANVLCIPGGVAISQDRSILAETFTCYWDRRFHHALIKSPIGYKLKEIPAAAKTLSGKYLYLDFQHISHYGHFIADVLPRLWAYSYARNYLNIPDLKILLTRKPEPFIHELLNLYGFARNDIHEIDQPVLVEDLFIATKALQLQDYVAPALQETWNTISLRATSGVASAKKVYLSRARHPQRMLLNEIDVEQIFKAKGFQIIYPEELSVCEQINLIAHAKIIAGTSGSNLFNLAFQQNLKSAFIITSPALIHITDSLLQVGRRCDLRTYIGEVATSHPSYDEHWVHSPWVIQDLRDLERAVGEWTQDYS